MKPHESVGAWTPRDPGWDWFEETVNPEAAAAELAPVFARVFRGPDGERALAHLRRLTLERCLGPGGSDAQLRHLEGQRQLVAYLQSLIDRGRDNPAAVVPFLSTSRGEA